MIKSLSTARYPPRTSRTRSRLNAGQLTRSRAVIDARGGVIVTEFFNVDKSRSIPWQRCPEATALLAELKNPSREFDAVVIGEPHCAVYGNQFFSACFAGQAAETRWWVSFAVFVQRVVSCHTGMLKISASRFTSSVVNRAVCRRSGLRRRTQ